MKRWPRKSLVGNVIVGLGLLLLVLAAFSDSDPLGQALLIAAGLIVILIGGLFWLDEL